MIWGGRWNSPGRRVIYSAESYAGALLEILVHGTGSVAPNQGYIEIGIPAGLPIEVIAPEDVPLWDAPSSEPARRYGDQWYAERRTPVLIVPSVVTPFEGNVLINQEHPDFPGIRASQPAAVRWDARLWTTPQQAG
jgi:RES domain-containing protein